MWRYRRSRSRSRSPCYDLKQYGIRDTRGRSGMERPTLSGGFYATGRCKRGSESRYLYMDGTKRHSDSCADDIMEHKRQRYSDIDSEESLVAPWGQRCITPDRLYRRQEHNFGVENDHELHRYRYRSLHHHEFAKGGLTCREVHRDASCDGGRFMEKDEPEEMTYDNRDFDVSFQQRSEFRSAHNIPCKYFTEGYCRYGGDCRFSHGEPLGHFGDHRRGYYEEIESSLSRKGPKRGDQMTNDDKSRPSRWRYDHGKQNYDAERDDSLSWDSPRRDNFTIAESRDGLLRNSLMWEEKNKTELETPNTLSSGRPKRGKWTKIEDSPDSSQHRLHGKQDCNGKTSRRFSRNGSKGGNLTTTKNATNSGKLSNSGRIASSSSSWNHSKWGDQTTAMVTPNSICRPEDDKQDPDVKVDKWKGPRWGDLACTEETPNSFQWRPDADVSTVKTDRTSPRDGWGDQTTKEAAWKGPKWGDQTTKETSWDGPKWSDHQTKYAATHKPPQETSDDKLDDNVKTGYSLSLDGSKWGEQKRKAMKDASRSSQCISNDGKRDSDVETHNGVLWDGPTWEEQSKTELETQTPNSLSTNGRKWSKQRTLEDSFNPSQQRPDDNRPDYNGKISRSFSRNGKGGRITTKNATNSGNWGNGGRIASTSSWDHPKCCEQTTSRATPNSSTCRSDDDKQGSDVKAGKSNGPKWYDQGTKKTTWKGPKWGDETTRETSWDGPKWGDQTTKETSWKHQKWGDQTTKETSWDGPKWGDHQSTKDADAHEPSQESPDNGKGNNNVKTENNLSWDGPDCCKQKSIQHSSISSLETPDFDRPYRNVKTDYNLSLDVSREGDQTSVQDAPYSSQLLSDADKWGNAENDYSSQFVQKCSDETVSEDAFISCRRRSDNDVHGFNIDTDKSLAQTDPKWDHQMTCKDAFNSSMWRSKNAGSGAYAAWPMAIEVTRDEPLQPSSHEAFRRALSSQEQDLTQVDSGKDQHVLTILQPPSNIYTFDFNLSGEEIQDQQNINVSEKGEQSLFPPPREGQSQGMPQSVAIKGQDAIPQPLNQESLNSDLQDHQVLVNSKQTLKPLIDEPYASTAATTVQTNLVSEATRLITSDSADLPRGLLSVSFQTKEQTMVDESLTSAKNSASSFFSAQPDNGNPSRKADEESKQELSANEANVGKETETLQSTNTQRTGQPEDVDDHLKAERDSGRTKDDQWIRMLKFALVEFVKDILKPYWREGHLSKEAHKTIVKKVVDKVTGTLRGPNIPRSQEQVDLYMSYSKTKLSNLVLGYLERHLKS